MFQNVEKNINNRQDFNEAFYDKKDKMKIAIKYFFLKGKNMTKIFVRLNNIRKRNK